MPSLPSGRHCFALAIGLGLALASACATTQTTIDSPYLEGPVKRTTAFRQGRPVIGQCVDALSGDLLPEICSESLYEIGAPLIPGKHALRLFESMSNGEFRLTREIVSVETNANLSGSASGVGAKSKAKVSVVHLRLVEEWSRYRTLGAV